MQIVADSFVFTRPELLALLAFISTDETRTHINSLGVFPSRRRVAATDGKRLAVLHAVEGPAVNGKDFVVPRAAIELACDIMRNEQRIPEIIIHRDRIESPILEIFSVRFTSPEGYPFPPYEQIIPPALPADQTPLACIGLDAQYLADIALIAAARPPTAPRYGILHMPAGPLDPILFVHGRWQVVLMPFRDDEVDKINSARQAPPITAVAKAKRG